MQVEWFGFASEYTVRIQLGVGNHFHSKGNIPSWAGLEAKVGRAMGVTLTFVQ